MDISSDIPNHNLRDGENFKYLDEELLKLEAGCTWQKIIKIYQLIYYQKHIQILKMAKSKKKMDQDQYSLLIFIKNLLFNFYFR